MPGVKEINVKYVTDEKGRKREVILPIKEFESLIEDLEDLAVVAERKNEESIDHEEVIKRLKRDGFL